MINYYSILELPEDASEEDIQAAYRKLARTMHPDKDPKKHRDIDPSATGKFRDVIEAYKILRDPIKKEKHDRDLHNTVKVSARKRRGSDVQVHLTVRADDIIIESLKHISTIRNGLCLSCNGTGTEARILSKCPKCNGSGIDVVSSVMGPKRFCSLCKGYGNIPQGHPCKNCGGQGVKPEKIIREIKLSREAKIPYTIVLQGSGNYMLGGKNPGNLLVEINIEKDSLFQIEGRDVKGKISISPAQAVLGDIIFIEVFGDAVKVPIPAGTQYGDTIRRENSGIEKDGYRGSLILKVEIEIPKEISEQEKDLYTQLLKFQKGFL
jgi:DnaJ-class molecular chaperone